MACERFAVATSYHRLAAASTTRKALFRCSAAPSTSLPLPPSRLTRRKNYLRQKLLKTLKQPYPGTLTPLTPQGPAEKTATQAEEELEDFKSEPSEDQRSRDSADPISKATPTPVEEFVVEAPKLAGWNSTPKVVKFGTYFAGTFVALAFVRAVAVALLDSDEEWKKSRNNRQGFRLNGIGSNNGNGQVLQMDEEMVEAKVAQIKAMAKEARESERRRSGDSGAGSNDLDDVGSEEDVEEEKEENEEEETEDNNSSKVRNVIEKEVDGGLSRVSQKLSSLKTQSLNVKFLNNKPLDAAQKGTRGAVIKKEEGEKLMFKKGYEFRSTIAPNELSEKPEGFGGGGSVNGVSRKSQKVENPNGSVQGESSAALRGADVTKDIKSPNGVAQDSSIEKTVDKASKLRPLNNSKPRIILSKGEDKHDAVHSNGKSRTKSAGKGSTAKITRKQPNNNSDLWWQDLPYLLAILMQDDSKHKGKRGFYSLDIIPDKSTQTEQESCTVLFEDRDDALNFSNVLKSYFEELGDIKVFAVPLPIETLKDAMKSWTINVIFVRRGQLKLYAGQPLDEVETTLRSLVNSGILSVESPWS